MTVRDGWGEPPSNGHDHDVALHRLHLRLEWISEHLRRNHWRWVAVVSAVLLLIRHLT